jgi:DNA-binding transcriptional LysR family regulator
MRPFSPTDLSTFLTIAQHGSFRRAADVIGCTPSALSHAMRALEERLDLRLINRTTRSVALTEAGAQLYARISPAFRDISDALDDLNNFRVTPTGNLRINAARPSAQIVLLPLVTQFLTMHPKIKIELVIENALVDTVSEGFDAGVRLGETVAKDMIAIPIGRRQRTAIIASPAFFKRFPKPLRPEQLRELPCIRLRFGTGRLYAWEFERGGIELTVEVDGPLTLSDQDLMVEAAVDGVGVAFAFESQAQPLLDQGRLLRVLEDWCPYYSGFYFYYPSRRQLPAPLRVFVDFIKSAGREAQGKAL